MGSKPYLVLSDLDNIMHLGTQSSTAVKAAALRPSKQRGSALLATLCFAAVLSLSLSSYLAVCYRSLVLSNRSLHSSHTMELAEMGMEQALWSLNTTGGFDGTWNHPIGTTALKTFSGFVYENGAVGQVAVKIENYLTTPAITVVGSITLADHTVIARTLQSDARPAPLFTKAVGALNSLTFNFGGLVDSYNSTLATYTPTDPAHLTALNSAAVLSAPTINVGTAQIYGFAVTNAPTVPEPTPFLYQTGAKVIGPDSVAAVDSSRRITNPVLPQYDVSDPAGGTYRGTLSGSDVLATAGVYRYDAINLADDTELVITAPVILKVANSVQTSGTGKITVTGAGSLELQIDENDGQGLVLQGAGIVNETQLPRNVSVIVGGNYTGTPTSSIDVTNNFYGTVYLPNDTLTVGSNSNIFGALLAKDIIFSGPAPALHYDSALQNVSIADINAPFTLVQLREVSPATP